MHEQARLFERTPDEVWAQLTEAYHQWHDYNHRLLNPSRDLIGSINAAESGHKELPIIIAETALEAFTHEESASVYREKIIHMVTSNPRAQELMRAWNSTDLLFAAQNIEIFGQDIDALSPAEALLATAKNLEIAEEYIQKAGEHAEGALLSGSSAWGSNFTTRNHRPELGSLRDKPSDVDLLIEVKDCDELEHIIHTYAAEGLIEDTEIERFNYFAHMFRTLSIDEKAQMYSLRAHTSGTEVSIHFITSGTMGDIVTLQEQTHVKIVQGGGSTMSVPYLKDFRPNTTSNGADGKGYDLHDVRGNEGLSFHPNNIAQNLDDELYGYIAESPLGAVRQTPEGSTYLMGIIPYFLAVHPVALGKHTAHMKQRIETMQRSIAAASEGAAVSVPRIEKMTPNTRTRVLGALQLQ